MQRAEDSSAAGWPGSIPSEKQRGPPSGPRDEPRWPQVGDTVGGYRLEARRGPGGQGIVFLARRAGRPHAIKFLFPALSERAWRELEVRLKLRRMSSKVLLGHGLWPDSGPRLLYLVMPYVRGRPLYAWARKKNRTAREAARLVLELVRQVVEIHREGVVHRDVKGSNVLVRHEDGQPVLVDFGLGTWVGAPEITNPLGLPGTRHYRSPEALRFRREYAGEHSPARFSDDTWAVGVLLYVLLTGHYPFTCEVPDEGALANVILYEEPIPPHVRNPRVPRALSELCLRLLEKHLDARYPNAGALFSELEAVLEEADASWDKTLNVTWGPDDATPTRDVRLTLGEWWARLLGLAEHAWMNLRHAAAWGSAVLVLGLVGWLAASLLPSSPESETPAATPQVASSPTMPEVRKPGQEMAPKDKPPEGAGGAAPARVATPAPVASATPPKDNKRMKTSQQASQPRKNQQEKQGNVLGDVARAFGAACAAGQIACASPATGVRPTPPPPPPAECPPDSLETMEELGLRIGDYHGIEFHLNPRAVSEPITVYASPDVRIRQLGSWERLPIGTQFSGELFLGEERVYGRITQAHLPNGPTLPVCLILVNRSDKLGVEKEPGSTSDAARINSSEGVRVVDHFE